jgi:hypothetical protein
MRISHALVVIGLLLGFCGCKSVSRGREAAALLREANSVWAETNKTTHEWMAEYTNGFGPDQRAQFPSNRAQLKVSSAKIVSILDEETRLINLATVKYEQAIAMISDEQQRKGMGLFVSSMRKDLEMYKFIQSQTRLASDESIVDAKTFEEKFLSFGREIGRVRRESRTDLDEGKRLLGM